jgi:hypothetical protein
MDDGLGDDVLSRVQIEYTEKPALRLTSRQAEHLWNLSKGTCEAALYSLVRSGFLWQAGDGAFERRRPGGGPAAEALDGVACGTIGTSGLAHSVGAALTLVHGDE